MTSCTASFRETSAVVGDTLHADFTWTDAAIHSSGVYSAMYIINPSGLNAAVALNYVHSTGNYTLDCVADEIGTWTCRIVAWNGSEWIEATDTIYVSSGGPVTAEITYFNIAPNPVPMGSSTTVSVTGKNTGPTAEYFCIGIWSEQHGDGWSEWFWINPNQTFSWNRVLSNVQYEQSCATLIWWWDGSQSQNVAEEWMTIFLLCEGYTNKTDCEAAGCWWWNGICQTDQPTQCSQLNNQSDCERWGCWWWNGSCHDDQPTSCEQLNNQSDCTRWGCPWWNNACHNYHPSTCEELNNQTDCELYSCYWYNSSCHSEPPQPEICDWIDAQGGPTSLDIADVFVIIDSYLYNIPPSGYTFVPTVQNVFGVFDYFLGFDGDAATGCDFFT